MSKPISYYLAGGASISSYTQTAVISTSQTVAVPAGTKRIEALLCGGGGSGCWSNGASGGFGGLQIYEIPITGYDLDVIIGAGGTGTASTMGNRGGTTSVASGGTVYAAVGGGGAGSVSVYHSVNQAGLYGGSGGGISYAASYPAGSGGAPFNLAKLIWSALDSQPWSTAIKYVSNTTDLFLPFAGGGVGSAGAKGLTGWGNGGNAIPTSGVIDGSPGGGCAGSTVTGSKPYFGAGSGAVTGSSISHPGGSLTSVTVWGLTGFAGGLGATGVGTGASGAGGGGMLAVGGNAVVGTGAAPNGGNGGGGGAGSAGTVSKGGDGGNGFAVFRFYS